MSGSVQFILISLTVYVSDLFAGYILKCLKLLFIKVVR